MKKLIFITLFAISALFANAATTTSYTIAASTTTNLALASSGSAYVSTFTLTGATNAATVSIYDNTTGITNIVGAYTYTSSYPTNYITDYTNYYGVVTSLTNLALYDVSATVARVTNTLSPTYVFSVVSGATATFTVNTRFFKGITAVTAANGGTCVLTPTYIQP